MTATHIVGDFNTPLSKMDRSPKQNINKDVVSLNNTLDEMDLTDIYRAFHPKEAKYTFFSSVHGTFSKIDHMLSLIHISEPTRRVLISRMPSSA